MTNSQINTLVQAANELINQVEVSLDYRPELRSAMSRARDAAEAAESVGGAYGVRQYFDDEVNHIIAEVATMGRIEVSVDEDLRAEVATLRMKVLQQQQEISDQQATISLLKELVCDLIDE